MTSPAYEKRARARLLSNERRLLGETLEAFHRRENRPPPTLAEIFAENQRNRERCPVTSDLFIPAKKSGDQSGDGR